MKHTSELKFLKSIISSGLLSNKTSTLDAAALYALNRNIKQMFRMLKFSLKSESSLLYFWAANKYLLNLFAVLIQKQHEFSSREIRFDTNLPLLKLKKKSSSVLVIGDINYSDIQFLNKLKLNNILLTTKINGENEKNSFGTYKINSELTNLKSICFYIVLINHILQKENKL